MAFICPRDHESGAATRRSMLTEYTVDNISAHARKFNATIPVEGLAGTTRGNQEGAILEDECVRRIGRTLASPEHC